MQQHWDRALGHADGHARIRTIELKDLADALRLGWQDFMASPTQVIFLCLIYPLVGFVLGSAAAGGEMMPLVYPLLAGFALLGPLAALGIYELSRRREAGQIATWTDMFRVVRSPAIGSIVMLGIMLLAIFLLWLGTARGLYQLIMGPAQPLDAMTMLREILGTSRGLMLLVIGNLVGAAFAVLVLGLTVVSFPILLDRDVTAGAAIRTSWEALRANPVVLTVWGVVIAVLLAVGMALVFVGLAVALPLLGHASWHLYRRLVV